MAKPDGDNVLKIIADALNGIAYYDDTQVVSQSITKEYSLEPKVVVRIQEV
jgi:Holliday junction resolvase RusA-like endonuclease